YIALDRLDATQLPDAPLISAITLAELAAGPLVAHDEHERAVRTSQVQQAEAEFDPVPFDTAAARAFGRVSASMRQRHRKVASRSFDALIAAVALANGLPVYTCNPGDFEGIEGLEVVAVPLPEAD
ncbi:MAG: type II toxin-antitoxin system VapC family toxin, partial [Marmoricola sp.]